MDIVLSSERIFFRKISKDDFPLLCEIFKDKEVMYAWEHAFSDEELKEWIDKNLMRYSKEGFSYFAAIEKETLNFLGVMGPLIENIGGREHMGIAYILAKKYWGQGYGAEGAKACMDYAFSHLGAEKVIAEIRPDNTASRRLAQKLGMEIEGEFIKHYNGKDMPHLIYSRRR
ncbi:MAG: GNAT family N-acetyltransferase [Oscillospiraceae bacterium]